MRSRNRAMLTIWPLKANISTTDYLYSNLHPYLVFKIGNDRKVTEIDDYGGHTPTWNEPISFYLEGWERAMEIKCYNHSRLGRDTLLTTCVIDIKELLLEGAGEDWFDMEDHMGEAGELLLRWTSTPDDIFAHDRDVQDLMRRSAAPGDLRFSHRSRLPRTLRGSRYDPGKRPIFDSLYPEDGLGRRSRLVYGGARPGNDLYWRGETQLMVRPRRGQFTTKGSNPYAVFRVGTQEYQTDTGDEVDQTVLWQDSFVFDLKDEGYHSLLHIICYSRNPLFSDSYLGEKKLYIRRFFDAPNGVKTVLLDRNGLNGGRFELEWEYIGNGNLPIDPRDHNLSRMYQSLRDTHPTDSRIVGAGNPLDNARNNLNSLLGRDLGPAYRGNMARPGTTLSIRPVKADLVRNINMWFKMDPYALVNLDGVAEERTNVCEDGHLNPIWNDLLVFKLDGSERMMEVTVLDRNRFAEDKLIGKATINVDDLLRTRSGEEDFELMGEELNPEGTIKLAWDTTNSPGGVFPRRNERVVGGALRNSRFRPRRRSFDLRTTPRRSRRRKRPDLTPSPQRMHATLIPVPVVVAPTIHTAPTIRSSVVSRGPSIVGGPAPILVAPPSPSPLRGSIMTSPM